MIIHNGAKYQIETATVNGREIAVKSGDGKRIEMPYYPERDTSAIAGELDAYGAYSLLSSIPLVSDTIISPDHIFIDGDRFVLAPHSHTIDERFIAPEGYEPVWALGATVFYLILGCAVFQGRGGKAQHADTPIPFLRADSPLLSNFVARCLSYYPADRPKKAEIASMIEDLKAEADKKHGRRARNLPKETAVPISNLWPEEMS